MCCTPIRENKKRCDCGYYLREGLFTGNMVYVKDEITI